jgi:hypothetical protein
MKSLTKSVHIPYCAVSPVPDRIREGPEDHQRQCMEGLFWFFYTFCFRVMTPAGESALTKFKPGILSSNTAHRCNGHPLGPSQASQDGTETQVRRSSRAPPEHQGLFILFAWKLRPRVWGLLPGQASWRNEWEPVGAGCLVPGDWPPTPSRTNWGRRGPPRKEASQTTETSVWPRS